MSSVAAKRGRSGRGQHRAPAAPLLTGWRRAIWVTVITALVAVLGLTGVLPQTVAPAQAAPPVANNWGMDAVNCSYGTTGAPGSNTSTVCWLNVSTWSLSPGSTTTNRTARIGAYTFTYDVRVTQTAIQGTARTLDPTTNSTWQGAGFGNGAYSTTGTTIFYARQGAGNDIYTSTVALSNIRVTNSVTGATVTSGYGLVMADAESTNTDEKVTFTSNVAIANLLGNQTAGVGQVAGVIPPGGGAANVAQCPVTGWGTSTVTCTGNSSGATGAIVGVAHAATSGAIALGASGGSRQAGVFGFTLSRAELTKAIVGGRAKAADQFTVTIKDSAGNTVGTSSTSGTGTSAVTGPHFLAAGTYTLSETGSPGTDLTQYKTSWQCTDPSGLKFGIIPTLADGTYTATVTLAQYQALSCTVTNTLRPPMLTLNKQVTSRFSAGDQFTVRAQNGATTVLSATTTGTNTTASTGSQPVIAGTTYTLGDLMASGTGANYGASLQCANARTGSTTVLPTFSGALGAGATATLTPQAADDITCTWTNAAYTPAFTFTKAQSRDNFSVGDAINYTFTLTNTGNTALTSATIAETTFTGSAGTPTIGNCTVDGAPVANGSALAIGKAMICTATTTASQADVNRGSIVNTASGTVTATLGTTPPAQTSTVTSTATRTTTLTFTKVASGAVAAGSTITYTYTAKNTGTVTLTGVKVNEVSFTGSGSQPVPGSCQVNGAGSVANGSATLAPNDTLVCTATYAVTQADIDAGGFVNIANATATPPTDLPPYTSPNGTATSTSSSNPSAVLTKDYNRATYQRGDALIWTVTLRNNGNVTLTNARITETAFTGGAGTAGTLPTFSGCTINGAAATNGSATLAPGASLVCLTTSYTTVQADVDERSVVNTVVASATAAGATPAPYNVPAVSSTVTSVPDAKLSFAKTVAGSLTVGSTLTYTFTAKNEGNVTLSNVTITEGNFTGAGTKPVLANCAPTTLAPQASLVCAAPYVVTQADLDAGSFSNTASASATSPPGIPAPATQSSTATSNVTATPKATFTKAYNRPTFQRGDVVTWTMTLTNTGNVSLNNARISETSFTGGPGTAGTLPTITECKVGTTVVTNGSVNLAPNQALVCTVSYTTTQDDVNDGSIVNTASASVTPVQGGSLVIPNAESTVTSTPTRTLSFSKVATGSPVVNSVLTYTFTAKNDGNVTMTGVTVTDSAFTGTATRPVPGNCLVNGAGTAVANGSIVLQPGDFVSCTAAYTVTQADIDAGAWSNTASALATTPGGVPTSSTPATATVTPDTNPSMRLTKDYDRATAQRGDLITWTLTLTNTGNVTLNNATITETAFTGGAGPVAPAVTNALPTITDCKVNGTAAPNGSSLAPKSVLACKVTYTVQQVDVDEGSVRNAAQASATPTRGTVATATAESTVTMPAKSELTFTKLASGTVAKDSTLTYTFTAKNSGNTTLSNVTITEGEFTGSGTPKPTLTTCAPATLAPGESLICTATYVVTQADMDAGGFANTASATGTPPGTTTPLPPTSSTATSNAVAAPAAVLTKAFGRPTYQKGDVVTWTVSLRNTGNVTLDNATIAESTFTGGAGPVAPAVTNALPAITGCTVGGATAVNGSASLAPGVSLVCTVSYTATQADVDDASIVNTVTATASPKQGTVTIAPASSTVTSLADPKVSFLKTVSGSATAGSTLTYTFTAKNEGNVTLSDVTITEGTFTGLGTPPVLTCPPAALAPQESLVCTATYLVTQADINAGGFSNTASATGTPPGTTTALPAKSSTVTTTVPANPAFTITKTTPVTSFKLGDTVTWTLTLANSGNVTLRGATIAEKSINGATTGLPALTNCALPNGSDLDPGESIACQASVTATQDDVDRGSIVNIASGTASGVSQDSLPSTVTAPAAPSAAVTKLASGALVAGTNITYTFTLRNTGNVTLSNATITEGAFTGVAANTPVPGDCKVNGVGDVVPNGSATLIPGATLVCTATYAVQQADVDRGSVSNGASATATPPTGTVTIPDATPAVTTGVRTPAFTMTKKESRPTFQVGDEITYTLELANTGNTTLFGATISESSFTGSASLPDLACLVRTGTTTTPIAGATAELLPKQVLVCSTTYTTTQADVDRGSLDNAATGDATGPTGTTDPPAQTPSITATSPRTLKTSFLKLASGTFAAGNTITYTMSLTNESNVTLTNATITEGTFTGLNPAGLVDGTCTIVGAGPGEGSTVTNGSATLAPRQKLVCTATYEVVQEDINEGTVSNTASGAGTSPGPNSTSVPSGPSTATSTSTPSPAFTLTAKPNRDFYQKGDNLFWTFTLTNTGNVSLTQASLSNPVFTGEGAPPALTCTINGVGAAVTPPVALDPGESLVCRTADYAATQSDVDDASTRYDVTGTVVPVAGSTPAPQTAGATIQSVAKPDVTYSKVGALLAARGGPGGLVAGTKLTYVHTLENSGNVTLTNVTITEGTFTGTGTLGAMTCSIDGGADFPYAPATLAPRQVLTCQAPYTVTQADVDAGSLSNTATGTGTPPGTTTPLVPMSDTATNTTSTRQAFSFTKEPKDPTFVIGEVVTWTMTLTNTGDVTLKGATITEKSFDDGNPTNPVLPLPTLTCSPLPQGSDLAPGASLVCTATRTATQDDVDSGSLTNVATAAITGNATPPAAQDASSTVTSPASPSATVIKKSSGALIVDTDITYTFTLRNTGNVTLRNATITDTGFTGAAAGAPVPGGCQVNGTGPVVPNGSVALAPNATLVCTATYAVQQSDVDRGSVINGASATATPPTGTVTIPDATPTETTTTRNPDFLFTKAQSRPTFQKGDAVTYTLRLTNTGNTTLTGATISETSFNGSTALPALSCEVLTGGTSTPITGATADLLPKQVLVCSTTYTATQADVDRGSLLNVATGDATGPAGTTDPPAQTPSVTATSPATVTGLLTKVASGAVALNSTVTYTLTLENTGNITLTNAGIAEGTFTGKNPAGLVDGGCTIVGAGPGDGSAATNGQATLLPRQKLVCTQTYTVVQADLDSGSISNTASGTGTPPGGSPTPLDSDTVTSSTNSLASVAFDKVQLRPTFQLGDTISYRLLLRNTGNVTLTDATITETAITAGSTAAPAPLPAITDCAIDTVPITTVTNGSATLDPGRTMECAASYTTTQADVDRGFVSNSASGSATSPTGIAPPTTQADTVVANSAADATSTFTKVGTQPAVRQGPGGLVAGSQLEYVFTFTNTGNVTITNATITEGVFSGSGGPLVLTCRVNDEGDPITGTSVPTLAPQSALVCRAPYTVTQADVDAGGDLTNAATATGTPVRVADGQPATINQPDTATNAVSTRKDASFVKEVNRGTFQLGDVITWTMTLTNTGDVTLKGATIAETSFADGNAALPLPALTCTPLPQGSDLAPGDSLVCTATRTATQDDVNSGSLANVATGSFTDPATDTPAPQVSPPSTTTSPMTATASLTKSGTGVLAVGQSLSYTFRLTNTGNVTLTGAQITDTGFTGSGALPTPGNCTIDGAKALNDGTASLAPKAVMTCTATYAVHQADVDRGSVENAASATATSPTGTPATIPPAAPIETTTVRNPAFTFTKAQSRGTFQLNDAITWTMTLTNSGNTTLLGATISETSFNGSTTALPTLTCRVGTTTLTGATTDLIPGQALVCTATATATQADVDRGSFVNVATGDATGPAGTVDPPAKTSPEVTSVSPRKAELRLTKVATGPFEVGKDLTYTFTLTNIGNVTMTGATITEGVFTGSGAAPVPTGCTIVGTGPNEGSTADNGAASLAPRQSLVCTATHPVTQADVDSGSITNSAGASALPPGTSPTPVTTSTSVTTDGNPSPSFLFTKLQDRSGYEAGDVITYTLEVLNTGNTTLSNVGVTEGAFTGAGDPPALVTCTVGQTKVVNGRATLAPLATLSCDYTYTTVQEDVDRGSITNAASASATNPSGGQVVGAPDSVTAEATRVAKLELTKVADTDRYVVGQEITFTYRLTNTGNVTLTGATIDESFFSGTGPAPTLGNCTLMDGDTVLRDAVNGSTTLAPGQSLVCSETYVATQADVDATHLVNTGVGSATAPAGVTPPADVEATFDLDANLLPDYRVTKEPNTDTFAIGRPLIWAVTLSNIGNTTLRNATLAEVSFAGGDGTLPALTDCRLGADGPAAANGTTTLAPGEALVCTTAYTPTQADMDAGAILNTASGQVTIPGSTTPAPATTVTSAVQGERDPVFHLEKIPSKRTFIEGEQISWHLRLVNDGNVTLTNARAIESVFTGTGSRGPSLIESSCVILPIGVTDTSTGRPAVNGATTLAPGELLDCATTAYTATAADYVAGSFSNTGIGQATAIGETVPLPDNGGTSTIVAITPNPKYTLTKAASQTTYKVGDRLTWTFTLQNIGNVAISGATISEGSFSGSGPAPTIDACTVNGAKVTNGQALVPFEDAMVCMSSEYVVTQADVDSGALSNSAAAAGTGPTGTPAEGSPSTSTVPSGTHAPGLSVDATPSITSGAKAGDTISYTVVVTNTGNVTLNGVVLTSGLAGLSDLNCTSKAAATSPSGVARIMLPLALLAAMTPTTMAPGSTITCTATYVVTDADVTAGSVPASFSATGKSPTGVAAEGQDSVTVTTAAVPTPPTPVPTKPLAFTGIDVWVYVGFGIALLLLGLVLVMVRRRQEVHVR